MSQDNSLSEEDIEFYASLGVPGILNVLQVIKDDCANLLNEEFTASQPCEYILEAFVHAKEEVHGWWPVIDRISSFPQTTPAEIGVMTGTFNSLLSLLEAKEHSYMCTLPDSL